MLDRLAQTVSLAQKFGGTTLQTRIEIATARFSGMAVAFTFPGQGSQAVGMGAELARSFPTAARVFEEVDEALGQKLSKIMWEGPEETLTLTENAQPALMAASLAAFRVLEADKGISLQDKVKFVAGHSLGEYSALAAAGAISLADAARLLKTRGKAMQAAVPVGQGAMAALIGAELDDAKRLAEAASQGEVCQTANDNAPGQVVISGARTAIDRAVEMAADYNARRAVLLPVSAPFHCALMQPAADVMAEALIQVEVKAPAVPVVANVLAAPVSDPDEIRKRLIEQVTGAVRWRESVQYMASEGVTVLYELGAGRVLTGLARRIERSLDAVAVGTPAEIEAAAAALA